jgi:hypothetical protein
VIGRELEPVNTSWLSLLLLLGLELVIELELDVVSAAETSAKSKPPRGRMLRATITTLVKVELFGKSKIRHKLKS